MGFLHPATLPPLVSATRDRAEMEWMGGYSSAYARSGSGVTW
jgi:hypothetical protein